MKTRKRTLVLAAGAAVALAILPLARIQGPPTQEVTVGVPMELSGVHKRPIALDVSYANLAATLRYDTAQKVVQIQWRRVAEKVVSTQDVPVSFWPTEVCGLGVNRICVAGKTPRDATVIEVWDLDDAFHALPATIQPGTGEEYFPKILVPIVSKTTVYSDAVLGRDMVSHMFQNLGATDSLFARFWDSGDLYRFELSGAMTKVLTPSDEVGVEKQPDLTTDYNDRWQAEHTGFGYVYFLCTAPNTTSTPRALLLKDVDRDGTLDAGGSEVLDVDDWVSMGFADASTFLRIY